MERTWFSRDLPEIIWDALTHKPLRPLVDMQKQCLRYLTQIPTCSMFILKYHPNITTYIIHCNQVTTPTNIICERLPLSYGLSILCPHCKRMHGWCYKTRIPCEKVGSWSHVNNYLVWFIPSIGLKGNPIGGNLTRPFEIEWWIPAQFHRDLLFVNIPLQVLNWTRN